MKVFTLICCILFCFLTQDVQATDAVIESQLEALDLSAFIQEGENYTKEIFPGLDVDKMLNSALTGKIDNKLLYLGILSMLGEEVISSITLMREYINNSSYT